MDINYKSLGFTDALDAICKLRLERRAKYGDGFKTDEEWELLAEIVQKSKRLKEIIINKRDENLYETKKEILIDLGNYTLFLLQNIIDKEKGDKY